MERRKLLFLLLIVVMVAGAIVAFTFAYQNPALIKPVSNSAVEQHKLAIASVLYDNEQNAVLLNVTAINAEIPLSKATIQDASGKDFLSVSISYNLPVQVPRIVTVNSALPSGSYLVILEDSIGTKFISSSFKVL